MERIRKSLAAKSVAWILILCLVVTLIPDIGYATEHTDAVTETTQVQETESLEQASANANGSENKEAPETVAEAMPDNVVEMTVNSTTYDLGNGEKEVEVYGAPVRFEDENEGLIDYDPSLVEITEEETTQEMSLEGYAYTNLAGDMKHYIPESLDADLPVRMEYKDYAIEFNLMEDTLDIIDAAKEDVRVETDEVQTPYSDEAELPVDAVYGDEEDAVEVKYTSMTDTVKETLVLNERPQSNVFTYHLKLTGMTARENMMDEGLTYYDDETGDIAGFMSAPWMNDATGDAYSEAITYDLEEIEDKDGEYLVTMTVDEDYLDDEDRQYPVTIDPSNTWQGTSEVKDVYVISGSTYKNTNFYDSSIKKMPVGVNSTGTHRTYIKFIDLKGITGGKSVSSAKFTVYETGTGASKQKIGIYRITSSWDLSGIKWSDKPTNASSAIASVTTSKTEGTAKTFDITSFVRKVADGDVTNYGVVLKNITDDPSYACFYGSRASSYKPKLVVTYYDKPTALSSMSLSKSSGSAVTYFPKGTTIYATWKGITSSILSQVQYRIVPYDTDIDITSVSNDNVDLTTYRSIGKAAASASYKSVPYSKYLPEGKYKLSLRGKDSNGYVSGGKYKIFYVDAKPVINSPSISPAPTSTSRTSNLSPTISCDVVETYPSKVTMSINGGTEFTVSDSDTTSKEKYKVPSGKITKTGTYTIRLNVYDKAGNKAYKDFSYYVDTTAPVITLKTNPSTTAAVPALTKTPKISWTVDESNLKSIKLYVNGTEVQDSALTTMSTSYTLKDGLLNTGSNTIKLKVTDSAGNASEKSLEYHVNKEDPVISTLTITPETGLLNASANRSPIVKWSVADSNFKNISCSTDNVNWTVLGTTKTGQANIPSSIWLSDTGKQTIYFKATDTSGAESVIREESYYLREAESYAPQNLAADENYGKRVLTWEMEYYDDTVTYDLHRGTAAGFTPTEDTVIAADIDASKLYFIDNELLDEGTYYYCITADFEDSAIEDAVSAQVSFINSLTVDDMKNTLGSKGYLSYTEMGLPTGTLSVEESSGNMVYSQEDFNVSNPQLSYGMSRAYNSGLELTSMTGKGWMDSYHMELFSAGEDIYMLESDGSVYKFTDGQCDETKDYVLAETDEGYTVTTKDDVFYTFNTYGQLMKTEEPNGCSITNVYDEYGRLVNVVSESAATEAKTLDFIYDETGSLLESITDFTGTEYAYTYDEDDLTSVTISKGNESVSFDYVYGTYSGKLETVKDGEGNPYTVAYSSGKAASITYPDGEKLSFTYEAGKTKIKKTVGGNTVFEETTTYDADTGKLLSHTDPAGKLMEYEYISTQPYLISKVITRKSYQIVTDEVIELHESEETENEEDLDVTTYTYDENENVISEIKSDGTITNYEYNSNDDIIHEESINSDEKITDITYEYYENYNLKKVTDSVMGTTEDYQYNEDGNEEIVIKADDDKTEITTITEYDSEGNVSSIETASGDVVTNILSEYDAMGRVTCANENGITTSYVYDLLGREIKSTKKEPGKSDIVKSMIYNGNGSLIHESETGSVSKFYEYDNRNRNIKENTIIDGSTRTRTTMYGYETDVTIEDGLDGRNEAFCYTETIKDTAGNIVNKSYIDKSGNVVKQVEGSSFSDYTYDKSGNQVVTYSGSAELEDSLITLQLYDEDGNESASITAPEAPGDNYIIGEGTIETYTTYDARGNLTSETVVAEDEEIITTYTYDKESRIEVIDVADDKNPEITVSYDGAEVEIKDAEDNFKYETINETGLTTDIVDKEGDKKGNSTETLADTVSEETETTNVPTMSTHYDYDSLGRKERELYSDGNYVLFTYEGSSNRIATRTAYDGIEVESVVNYFYDQFGRLIEVSTLDANEDEVCKKEYTYDSEGKILSESVTYADGEKQTTTSTYDIEGRLVSKAYPADSGLGTVSYTYNGNGQIISVSENDTQVRTYSYDAFDRISTVKDEMTDITCTYTYDDLSRVTSMVYTDDTGILESFGYVYDKQNNIIERSHVNNMPEGDKKIDELRQYVYDAHGNLTQSTKTNRLQNDAQTVTDYTYDEVGNRTAMTVDGENTSYTYNGLNQLLQVTNSDGTEILYTYDERGNQISETDQDVTIDMEYAVTGEMTKLTKTAAGEETDSVTFTQENVYDENGIRISRTQDGTIRNYYYDRGIVAYTTDGEELSSANILDVEGNMIGTYRDEIYYGYLKDGQASTTNIVKNDGTLSAAYDYTDFGETEELTGGDFDNQVCYTGGIYDEETALYYLNARYYDPEIGRFISQDTYRGEVDDPGQWHLYAYCANNPINYVDPSGHFAWALPAFELISAASMQTFISEAMATMVLGVITGISFSKLVGVINQLVVSTIIIQTLLNTLKSSVKKSWKRKKNKKNEKHHIVAKKAPLAGPGRAVLDGADIGINSSRNLKSIKYNLHKHIHTDSYHVSVSSIMVASSSVAPALKQSFPKKIKDEDKVNKACVKGTLKALKILIGAANIAAKR